MSLLNKDIKEKLSIVILCAGEGTRLKKISKNIPKPLIKIERLNNTPILHHTINNLLNFEVNHIAIVIGHLGHIIRDSLTELKKKNPTLNNKIVIIDSGNQYKLGPLYSFLSIANENKFFNMNKHFLIFPGDTIFDYNLLVEIFSIISENFTLINEYPFIFYKRIGLKPLKEIYNEKTLISNAEIETFGLKSTVKKITKRKIEDIGSSEVVNQLIPILVLNYDIINVILNLEKELHLKTLWGALNHIISKGKKILCFRIKSERQFYDIDSKHELNKQKKRKGQ